MFLRRLLLLITVLVLLFSVTIGWYAATWQQPPDRVNEIIDEMAR
jgi:hypothetical protein